MEEVESEGYLHQFVELMEDYAGFKKGIIGRCTADLMDWDDDEDIFAVMFEDDQWITFRGKGVRNKFKILYND